MTTPSDVVKSQLRKLVERYKSGAHAPEEEAVRELIIELDHQFPDDIGVFCVYLLNVVNLQPGEAIFLGAGEPHAYVAGGKAYGDYFYIISLILVLDIVETMATSDNVLRAGLTPKTRDVPNLVSSLTYHASPPSAHIVTAAPFSRGSDLTKLYNPPIPEFAVLMTHISGGGKETHDSLEGPSILIVTEGKGRVAWPAGEPLGVMEGSVLFVGANTQVTFDASEEMTVFRAFVEA